MKAPIPAPNLLAPAGLNEVWWRGRKLLHFSGCDYFRLTHDVRLAVAARAALTQIGLNVAASRRTTGDRALYHQLEAALARFFKAPTALLVADGYLAPIAAGQALAGEFSHVFLDELAHGALIDAAAALGGSLNIFPHRDAAALKKFLSRLPLSARPIVLTDGMFSHDGSVAPLAAYQKILPRNGWLLVDDAHGAGLLGAHGRGSVELEKVSRRHLIQCATLSKAFGAFGGVVLAAPAVREKIWARSRSLAGATPVPPPLAGAALAAVKILSTAAARRKKIFANTAWLRQKLRAAGWDIKSLPGPIIRLPVLSAEAEHRLEKNLLAAGIYPPFLKYGAVKHGTFRFVISSAHTREQLQRVVDVLRAVRPE